MSDAPLDARVRCYRCAGEQVTTLEPAEAAEEIVAAPTAPLEAADGPLLWIDILDPTDVEANYLRDQLGLHHLAVEDCLRGRQRPKVDRYPGYLFLVFYATSVNPARGRMALSELHIFLGTSYIITVHDQPIAEITHLIEEWRRNPERFNGPGAATHAVLDAITDNYFPVMEHFSDRLDEMEQKIFTASPNASTEEPIKFRQEMILLRRILAPQRDVLSSLLRRDLPFIDPDLLPYFYDVLDHTLRVTEEIDAFRDLVTGLIEVQSTNAANRLNQTMQMLTGWSIILMSMGLIAGIYGMNFVWMPELEWRWGYIGALGIMVMIGATLLALFRRKGWL